MELPAAVHAKTLPPLLALRHRALSANTLKRSLVRMRIMCPVSTAVFWIKTQNNNSLIKAVTITVAAFLMPERRIFTSKEPFETMPDVMDAKQLAKALQISKASAYNLLNDPNIPTLRIGGRKLVMKNELVEWLKSRTNR